MNQQRPADAAEIFEKLSRRPEVCRGPVNLGVSLLASRSWSPRVRRSKRQRAAPKDASWVQLGLAYKDPGDGEGIAAFQNVTQIAPNEPDAYYFAAT